MKFIIIAIISVAFTTAAYASTNENNCLAITKDKLCIQMEWTEGPFLNAYSQNVVKFKDIDASRHNQEVFKSPEGSIQFFSWMIMHGHQHGGRPVETKQDEPGIYDNSKIYYMGGMMGSWQFKLKINSDEFILHSLQIEN